MSCNWFFFAVVSHLQFICDELIPYFTIKIGHLFCKVTLNRSFLSGKTQTAAFLLQKNQHKRSKDKI